MAAFARASATKKPMARPATSANAVTRLRVRTMSSTSDGQGVEHDVLLARDVSFDEVGERGRGGRRARGPRPDPRRPADADREEHGGGRRVADRGGAEAFAFVLAGRGGR